MSLFWGGCSITGFEMPRGHCALAPQGCDNALPSLFPHPDYPKYVSGPWARDGMQGLAHDEDHWYLTSTTRIWKVPRDKPLAEARTTGLVPFDGQYRHLGDLDFHRGALFVPLEGDRRGGPPAIGALRTDLTTLGVHPLEGAREAPWCAVHPETGRLYTSDFHADRIRIFRVELAPGHFALVHERDLILRYSPETARNRLRGKVPRIQGGVISRGGRLYLATDHVDTGIVVFDAHTGTWIGRIPIEFKPALGLLTHQEVEGLDLVDLDDGRTPSMKGQLHLLLRSEFPTRRYWVKHWGVHEEASAEQF